VYQLLDKVKISSTHLVLRGLLVSVVICISFLPVKKKENMHPEKSKSETHLERNNR
jgi:hypothetical protein